MAAPRVREILIADDDKDDVLLFKDAIAQSAIAGKIAEVYDGEKLMFFLHTHQPRPDIVFLDVNMPLKNGIECLMAIKDDKALQRIPVIIISTSSDSAVVNQSYAAGAQYYICKPNDFLALKNVIQTALHLTAHHDVVQTSFDQFVLRP